jgi:hypothetical protein
MNEGYPWPSQGKKDRKYEEQNPDKMHENGEVGQELVNHLMILLAPSLYWTRNIRQN